MKINKNSSNWILGAIFYVMMFLLVGCGSGAESNDERLQTITETGNGTLAVKISIYSPNQKSGQTRATDDICDYDIAYINAFVYNSNGNEVRRAHWDCKTPQRQGTLDSIPTNDIYRIEIFGQVSSGETPWSATVENITVSSSAPTIVSVVLKHDASDDEAPYLSNTFPADGAMDAPTNRDISATFSERIVYDEDRPTISADNFILINLDANATVPCEVEYDTVNFIAILRPADQALLLENTNYEARIFNIGALEIEDMAGRVMPSPTSWKFKTALAETVDNTAPDISGPTTPVNGASNVVLDPVIQFTYTEPMKSLTLNSENIYIRKTGDNADIDCDIKYTNSDYSTTLTPLQPLLPNTNYTITITTGVTDTADNHMNQELSWSFTTVSGPVLSLPLNEAIINQSNAQFEWNTNYPASFQLLISTSNATLSGILSNPIEGLPLTDSTYLELPKALLTGGSTYYWQVLAYPADSSAPAYSGIRQFATINAPTLISPNNDAYLENGGFDLTWTPVEGAVNYEIFVSEYNDPQTNTIVHDTIIPTSTSSLSYHIQEGSLRHDVRYFWQVIAFAEEDQVGVSSGVFTFLTEMVSFLGDLYQGTDGSYPADFAEFDGYLYFSAETSDSYRTLLRTNGTQTGTTQIPYTEDPKNLKAIGASLYFSDNYFDSGETLCRIEENENRFSVISGTEGLHPSEITQVGDLVFFAGYDDTDAANVKYTIYYFDPSDDIVHEVYISEEIRNIKILRVVGDTLYFSCSPKGDYTITYLMVCKPDSTAPSPYERSAEHVVYSDSGTSAQVRYLKNSSSVELNGSLLFIGYESTTGNELWSTNGATNEAYRIADICSGTASCTYSEMTYMNGLYYFFASESITMTYAGELWQTDGTAEGTVPVEINGQRVNPGNNGTYMAALNGELYFRSVDDAFGDELRRWNGSSSQSPSLVYDVAQGSQGSHCSIIYDVWDDIRKFGDFVFFRAKDPAFINNTGEMWKTDGTAENTKLINLRDGTVSSAYTPIAFANGVFYFVGYDDTHGGEMWAHIP